MGCYINFICCVHICAVFLRYVSLFFCYKGSATPTFGHFSHVIILLELGDLLRRFPLTNTPPKRIVKKN
jgi:hypothetical protein